MVGRWDSRGTVAAAAASPTGEPGCLLLLVDEATQEKFLVDSGSAFSIIPFSSTAPATGPAIMAADRASIKCWGSQRRSLLAANRHYTWNFLRAEVAFPIVGADFLTAFDLTVDLKRRRLVEAGRYYVPLSAPPAGSLFAPIGVVAAQGLSSPGSRGVAASTASLPTVEARLHSAARGGRLQGPPAVPAAMEEVEVAREFPEVVNVSKKLPQCKHRVQHVIDTTCTRPVSSRYRRLPPEKLEAAKREFAELEAQGIIEKSNSQWSSPLHMVEKPDGTWRCCGDYRRLNLVTKPDLYPPPHVEDLSARLAGMKVFSKLDLRKGYHQIPVAARDVQKTAIITPFGLYHFKRTPFGLRNAGQTFQRFMDDVLSGVPHVFVYLDDVLVASPSHAEHKADLRAVMQRLQKNGLVLNREKCVFHASSVEYLGYKISAEGLSPLPARVAAIKNYPEPATRGELQRFLGMINYYRRFISGAAAVMKPLTDATRGKGGRSTRIEWTAEMATAFDGAKSALASSAVLAHPKPGAQISLAVDASNHHVGGVLQQKEGGSWRPLAFFSRKLNHAESRYSTFDRELLACVASIRHFRFLVEGRKFCIFTDHKPLTFSLHRVSDAWSARQQRHLSYVAEYTSDVRHVAGEENIVADSLSRPPEAVHVHEPAKADCVKVPSGSQCCSHGTCGTAGASTVAAVASSSGSRPVNWSKMAEEQATWQELEIIKANSSLKVLNVEVNGARVWCDASTDVLRPVVPPGQRENVFQHVHGLAHAGIRATCRMISSRFVWPGLATDVKAWCKSCTACQRAKVTQQEKTPVIKIPIPTARFSHIHVDIVGPWPASRAGSRYLLTMIDRSTRWFEAAPLPNITAELVLDTFVEMWVARFGVPRHVTTDKGTQFTSGTWGSWCQRMGVEHIKTTSFHPQSNGMVERLHRQIKDALRARGAATTWQENLPWVLLGLRTAPKDESNISTAEVTLGHQLTVPGQFQPTPSSTEHVPRGHGIIPETARSYAEVAAGSKLDSAEWVYVRRGGQGTPLADNYLGPYKVVSRDQKVFRVQMGEAVEVISRDRLKPHLGEKDPVPAVPPRRGRPRADSTSTIARLDEA